MEALVQCSTDLSILAVQETATMGVERRVCLDTLYRWSKTPGHWVFGQPEVCFVVERFEPLNPRESWIGIRQNPDECDGLQVRGSHMCCDGICANRDRVS